MINVQQEVDEFNRNCGIIIGQAAHIESSLEFLISNYFSNPQTRRTFLLSDTIITELSFERKIAVFKRICEEEHIEKGRVEKVIESIRFVQEKRNRIAHGQTFLESIGTIKLQKRKSSLYKKDELELTPELMKQLADRTLAAVQGINGIYLELSDPSRKIESESF